MDPVKRIVQHIAKSSKSHHAIAASITKCRAVTKAAKDGKPLDLDRLNELLEEMLEHHSAIGDEGEECVEACNKSLAEAAEKTANDRLNKRDDIQKPPAGFTTIVPTRAMPRTGQPAVPLAKSEPQLAAVAGLNEEDLHPIEAE